MSIKIKNKINAFAGLKYYISLILIYCIFSSCNDYPAVTGPSENNDSLEKLKHGLDSLLKLNNSNNLPFGISSNSDIPQDKFGDSAGLTSKINIKTNFIEYPLIIEPGKMNASESKIFIDPQLKNIFSLGAVEQERMKTELKSSARYSYSKIINPLGLFYLKYKFNKTYYRELKNNIKGDVKPEN
jgi:hypothetical protein